LIEVDILEYNVKSFQIQFTFDNINKFTPFSNLNTKKLDNIFFNTM